MRGLVAAVALAVSGLAQGQVIGTDAQVGWPAGTIPFGQMDWAMPVGGSSQAMFLPFLTAGCYASGTAMGTRGEVVSITRATTATYTDCAGLTQTCASGEMRVGCESGVVRGLLVERQSINYAFPSEDISTWTDFGTTGVTTNQGPAGFTDLDLVTSTTNTGVRYVTGTTTSTQGPVTGCAWVAASAATEVASIAVDGPDGTWTVTCSMSDGGACTATNFGVGFGYGYATVGTTPVRLCVTATTTGAAGTSWVLSVHDGQYNVTGNQGVLFGRATLEVGSTPTSYIPTTSGSAQRNADVPSVPWPTLPNTNNWCIEDTLTPFGGRSWDVGAVNRGYFSAGTPGSANSAWVFTNGTGLWGQLYDNASATRDITWTHGYTAGSSHVVKLCNDGTTLRLYSDGTMVGSDTTGGTGTWATPPTTLYPHGTGGAQPSGDAYNRTIKVYKSAQGR